MRLEVPERHPIDLGRYVVAHAEADLLRDAGHEPALHEREHRAGHIEREHREQDGRDTLEVDAARARDPGHEAVGERRGGLAEDLGAEHREHGRGDGQHDDHAHRDAVAAHVGEQSAQRPLEILGLLAGHHAAHGPMPQASPAPA